MLVWLLLGLALFLLLSTKSRLGETVDNCHNEIGDHGENEHFKYLTKEIARVFASARTQFCLLFGKEGLDWISDQGTKNRN